MDFFQSAILGIVQGLTEFLPVSSTAHMRIVPSLLGWEDPGTEVSAVIQLGTVLSVVIYFWKDLITIYSSTIRDFYWFMLGHTDLPFKSRDGKFGVWILVGTIPICVFGLLFKSQLEGGVLRGLDTISIALIVFALLLLFSEGNGKQNREFSLITFKDVLVVGIAQALSLIPGASRSGVTILAALFLGFKRSDSARFSFLLGVPAIVLSGLLEFVTLVSNIKNASMGYAELAVGIVFAFISGYWSIGFLIKYLQNHKTYLFVIYRVILGILIFLFSHIGLIK